MGAVLVAATGLLTSPAAFAGEESYMVEPGQSVACAEVTHSLSQVNPARAPQRLITDLTAAQQRECATNAPTAAPAGDWRAQQRAEVNAARKLASPRAKVLRACPVLDRAAQKYAELMASTGHYDHTGPDGSSPGDRITREKYEPGSWGENIAMGYATSPSVTNGWINSDGHYRNIISDRFRYIGFGSALSPDGENLYWVQKFSSNKCPKR